MSKGKTKPKRCPWKPPLTIATHSFKEFLVAGRHDILIRGEAVEYIVDAEHKIIAESRDGLITPMAMVEALNRAYPAKRRK